MVQQAASLSGSLHSLTKEPGTPPWPWRPASSGTDSRLPQDFLGACTFLEEANNEQVNKQRKKEHFGCRSGYADKGRPRLASHFPVAPGSGLVSALRMWRLQIARQLQPGAAGKRASRRLAGPEPPRRAPRAHRGRLACAEPPAPCAPGLWRSPIAARLHDGQHQGSPVLHEVRGDGPPLCAELTPPLGGLGAWPDPRESFSLLTSSP
ncbi:uncharacterized protein LOC122686878 [Cervus elaphus]|uniref:uncharacterized protein LOC122686878 n=1 Tax=Cervus elaphus TaxID=9860 RepID=UPI001CC2FDBC|nr:uncharacterized protein LOC122686878 [Cervus elaphus]